MIAIRWPEVFTLNYDLSVSRSLFPKAKTHQSDEEGSEGLNKKREGLTAGNGFISFYKRGLRLENS